MNSIQGYKTNQILNMTFPSSWEVGNSSSQKPLSNIVRNPYFSGDHDYLRSPQSQNVGILGAVAETVSRKWGEIKESDSHCVQGAILGPYSKVDSWEKLGCEAIGGLHPAADVRDFAYHSNLVRQGHYLHLAGVGLAAIGFIPIFGDAIKTGAKVTYKVAADSAAGIKSIYKKAGEDLYLAYANKKYASGAVPEFWNKLTREIEINPRFSASPYKNSPVDHGFSRHGGGLGISGLANRAWHTRKPKFIATEFSKPKYYLQAYKAVSESRELAEALAKPLNRKEIVIAIPMRSVFNNPGLVAKGVLKITDTAKKNTLINVSGNDSMIRAIYRRDGMGNYNLLTIFPVMK